MVGGVKIGNRCCLKASSEELSQEPSSFRTPRALSPPPLPQATSMCSRACRSRSSISLAARRSEVSAWDYAGGVKISSGCCLRTSPLLGTFPGTFFIMLTLPPPTPLPQATLRCSRAWNSPPWSCTTASNSQVCLVLLGWGMVGGVKIGNRLRLQGNIQRTSQDLSPLSPLPCAP